MPRPREELLVSATTMDMLGVLAADLRLTPAGVVHFLASRELGDRAEPSAGRGTRRASSTSCGHAPRPASP